MHIIDRRRNPQGKSLSNRQRFLKRAKRQITEAVRQASSERRIRDVADGERIVIPADGLHEPRFRPDPDTGPQAGVVPGHKTFEEGDWIPPPHKGGGGGAGREGTPAGERPAAFGFVLTTAESP